MIARRLRPCSIRLLLSAASPVLAAPRDLDPSFIAIVTINRPDAMGSLTFIRDTGEKLFGKREG